MENGAVAFPMVGSHSVAYLFVHLVWATRGRHYVISRAAEKKLHEVLRAKATACRCVLVAFGAASDHVHVLVQHPPTLSVAELAGGLKGVSSRAMNAGRYVTEQRERHARGATRREWELSSVAAGAPPSTSTIPPTT